MARRDSADLRDEFALDDEDLIFDDDEPRISSGADDFAPPALEQPQDNQIDIEPDVATLSPPRSKHEETEVPSSDSRSRDYDRHSTSRGRGSEQRSRGRDSHQGRGERDRAGRVPDRARDEYRRGQSDRDPGQDRGRMPERRDVDRPKDLARPRDDRDRIPEPRGSDWHQDAFRDSARGREHDRPFDRDNERRDRELGRPAERERPSERFPERPHERPHERLPDRAQSSQYYGREPQRQPQPPHREDFPAPPFRGPPPASYHERDGQYDRSQPPRRPDDHDRRQEQPFYSRGVPGAFPPQRERTPESARPRPDLERSRPDRERPDRERFDRERFDRERLDREPFERDRGERDRFERDRGERLPARPHEPHPRGDDAFSRSRSRPERDQFDYERPSFSSEPRRHDERSSPVRREDSQPFEDAVRVDAVASVQPQAPTAESSLAPGLPTSFVDIESERKAAVTTIATDSAPAEQQQEPQNQEQQDLTSSVVSSSENAPPPAAAPSSDSTRKPAINPIKLDPERIKPSARAGSQPLPVSKKSLRTAPADSSSTSTSDPLETKDSVQPSASESSKAHQPEQPAGQLIEPDSPSTAAQDPSEPTTSSAAAQSKSALPASGDGVSSRYFIMKCDDARNAKISLTKGIWATTNRIASKLNAAFRNCSKVFLFWSVDGSQEFCGFGQMTSASRNQSSSWVGSKGNVSFPLTLDVQWLSQTPVGFDKTAHLKNSLNQNKPIKYFQDGQELNAKVGLQLLNLFEPSAPGPAPEALDAQPDGMDMSPPPSSAPAAEPPLSASDLPSAVHNRSGAEEEQLSHDDGLPRKRKQEATRVDKRRRVDVLSRLGEVVPEGSNAPAPSPRLKASQRLGRPDKQESRTVSLIERGQRAHESASEPRGDPARSVSVRKGAEMRIEVTAATESVAFKPDLAAAAVDSRQDQTPRSQRSGNDFAPDARSGQRPHEFEHSTHRSSPREHPWPVEPFVAVDAGREHPRDFPSQGRADRDDRRGGYAREQDRAREPHQDSSRDLGRRAGSPRSDREFSQRLPDTPDHGRVVESPRDGPRRRDSPPADFRDSGRPRHELPREQTEQGRHRDYSRSGEPREPYRRGEPHRTGADRYSAPNQSRDRFGDGDRPVDLHAPPRDSHDQLRDFHDRPRDPHDRRDLQDRPRDPQDRPRDQHDRPRDPQDRPRDLHDRPRGHGSPVRGFDATRERRYNDRGPHDRQHPPPPPPPLPHRDHTFQRRDDREPFSGQSGRNAPTRGAAGERSGPSSRGEERDGGRRDSRPQEPANTRRSRSPERRDRSNSAASSRSASSSSRSSSSSSRSSSASSKSSRSSRSRSGSDRSSRSPARERASSPPAPRSNRGRQRSSRGRPRGGRGNNQGGNPHGGNFHGRNNDSRGPAGGSMQPFQQVHPLPHHNPRGPGPAFVRPPMQPNQQQWHAPPPMPPTMPARPYIRPDVAAQFASRGFAPYMQQPASIFLAPQMAMGGVRMPEPRPPSFPLPGSFPR
eukprot:m.641720 g.641720  ORF g.641720 m.641720 type:complete len:1498 (+) comp58345_c0_seq33:67-4560(+)